MRATKAVALSRVRAETLLSDRDHAFQTPHEAAARADAERDLRIAQLMRSLKLEQIALPARGLSPGWGEVSRCSQHPHSPIRPPSSTTTALSRAPTALGAARHRDDAMLKHVQRMAQQAAKEAGGGDGCCTTRLKHQALQGPLPPLPRISKQTRRQQRQHLESQDTHRQQQMRKQRMDEEEEEEDRAQEQQRQHHHHQLPQQHHHQRQRQQGQHQQLLQEPQQHRQPQQLQQFE